MCVDDIKGFDLTEAIVPNSPEVPLYVLGFLNVTGLVSGSAPYLGRLVDLFGLFCGEFVLPDCPGPSVLFSSTRFAQLFWVGVENPRFVPGFALVCGNFDLNDGTLVAFRERVSGNFQLTMSELIQEDGIAGGWVADGRVNGHHLQGFGFMPVVIRFLAGVNLRGQNFVVSLHVEIAAFFILDGDAIEPFGPTRTSNPRDHDAERKAMINGERSSVHLSADLVSILLKSSDGEYSETYIQGQDGFHFRVHAPS